MIKNDTVRKCKPILQRFLDHPYQPNDGRAITRVFQRYVRGHRN